MIWIREMIEADCCSRKRPVYCRSIDDFQSAILTVMGKYQCTFKMYLFGILLAAAGASIIAITILTQLSRSVLARSGLPFNLHSSSRSITLRIHIDSYVAPRRLDQPRHMAFPIPPSLRYRTHVRILFWLTAKTRIRDVECMV